MERYSIIFTMLALALFTLGCASTTPASDPSDPLFTGTIVPGIGLGSKLAWLQKNVKSSNTYILELGSNGRISPQRLDYGGLSNITIILRGKTKNRTVRLSANGSMFDIFPGVTLVLDNNITLQGSAKNLSPLIYVKSGTLIMNSGASIIGNTSNTFGGGVYLIDKATLIMNGGAFSGNTALGNGGGVYAVGGTISFTGT